VLNFPKPLPARQRRASGYAALVSPAASRLHPTLLGLMADALDLAGPDYPRGLAARSHQVEKASGNPPVTAELIDSLAAATRCIHGRAPIRTCVCMAKYG
jgi:hypothetical protein